MAPRKSTAVAIEQAVQLAPDHEITVADTKEAQHRIDTLVGTIRATHTRIKDSVLEIGRQFFELKKHIDSLSPDFRRVMKIQSFTAWMNTTAPDLCGMSSSTAWNYYRSYSEAEATGLEDKTIRALSPSVLKSEKARKAIVTVLKRKPELAIALNTAAHNPKQLKEIAKSDEMRTIIGKLEEPEKEHPRSERISRAIVSTYRSVFRQNEEFNLRDANAAIDELVSAVQAAAAQLGIGAHLVVTSTPIRKEELQPAVQPVAAVTETALPKNQQEAVEQLSRLIQSGAARVVAVGA